jgi:hypothetical protein
MDAEKKRNIKAEGSDFTGGKILTGALYIVTVLFVLGFLWQSIVSFVLQ